MPFGIFGMPFAWKDPVLLVLPDELIMKRPGLKTSFVFGDMPRATAEPKMQVAGLNPEARMKGQVHYPDYEGCYAGCAADSMAGGKSYGALAPNHFFKKPDEEEEVPPLPPPPGSKPKPKSTAPRRQKVCDPWGRITGAYKGKFCQGSDSCVTALPQDFGQRTGASFCPGGDCSGKAGHPWCVPAKFLALYDGPIEINCKSSGEGTLEEGDPSGCWWFLRNLPHEELQRLPGIVVSPMFPEKGDKFLRKYGKGLTDAEAERWVVTGQLVDPDSAGPDPDHPSHKEMIAEITRERDAKNNLPPGSLPPAPRHLPMAEDVGTPVVGGGLETPPTAMPTRSGVPHPKQRRGKPGGDLTDSFENREEGGSGRLGDDGEEDAMPFTAGLLGPPPAFRAVCQDHSQKGIEKKCFAKEAVSGISGQQKALEQT